MQEGVVWNTAQRSSLWNELNCLFSLIEAAYRCPCDMEWSKPPNESPYTDIGDAPCLLVGSLGPCSWFPASTFEWKEFAYKFHDKWTDEDGQQILMFAVSTLCAVNDPGLLMEHRIVLAQAALELFCNVHNIQGSRAGDKLDKFLQDHIKCGANVPDSLPDLKQWAASEGISSSGVAMAQIRNMIVHSCTNKLTKQFSTPNAVIKDCVDLFCRYLELAILHYLEYQGEYSERPSWTNELVPWH